jgi:hypothetical protein
MFNIIKVARDKAYKKALEVGLVETIKRFDVLTIGEEKNLLAYDFILIFLTNVTCWP